MSPKGRPEGESTPKRFSAEGRRVSSLAFRTDAPHPTGPAAARPV